MSSREVSGKANTELIIQLADMLKANPWLNMELLTMSAMKDGRSLVEREIINLAERIGQDRRYSLAEVVGLLLTMAQTRPKDERLLVAPPDVLDLIPPGKRVDTIPNYLDGIVKKAEREVLLLAPFWDMPTLVNLLHCTSSRETKPELILLLVHLGERLPRIQSIVDGISSNWKGNIRIYLHLAKHDELTTYPHAKCLVVDRTEGYLGSANFMRISVKSAGCSE